MIPKRDEPHARPRRQSLREDFDLGTQRIAWANRNHEARVFDGEQAPNAVGEQVAGHGGGKRHDQMAGADQPAESRMRTALSIQKQRDFVAHQTTEGQMVVEGDRS